MPVIDFNYDQITTFQFESSNYSTQHFITTNGLYRDPALGYAPFGPYAPGDHFRQNIGEHWALAPQVTDYVGNFKDYDSAGGLPPMGGRGIANLLNSQGVTVYSSPKTISLDDGRKIDRMTIHFEAPQPEEDEPSTGNSRLHFFSSMASLMAPPSTKDTSEYVYQYTGGMGGGDVDGPVVFGVRSDNFHASGVDFVYSSFDPNLVSTELNVPSYAPLADLFKNFSTQLEGHEYHDMSFNIHIPMNEKILSAYNDQAKMFSAANVAPKYNFYISLYEEGSSIEELPEVVLPNIYAFDDVLRSSTKKKNSLKSAVTLWNKIANVTDIFKSKKEAENNPDDIVPNTINAETKLDVDFHYFESYGKIIQSFVFDETEAEYREAKYAESKRNLEHIVFTPTAMAQQNTINQLKNVFPMYTDISFDTEHTSQFLDLLNSVNLYLPFVKYTISKLFNTEADTGLAKGPAGNTIAITPNPKPLHQTTAATGESVGSAMIIKSHISTKVESPPATAPYLLELNNSSPPQPVEENVGSNQKSADLRACSIQKFLDFHNSANAANNLVGAFGTYFGDVEEPSSLFSKQINTMLFNVGFDNMKKKHHRNYAAICNGKKAHTETLFYRIEKSLNGEVIQNIWMPNVDGQKKINYIDTQIKYGVGYDYNIYAYKIVFGSKYKYNFHIVDKNHPTMKEDISPEIGGNLFSWQGQLGSSKVLPFEGTMAPGQFTGGIDGIFGYWSKKNSEGVEEEYATFMDAIVKQNIMLVEVPYYNVSSILFDDPPMPPEVEFLPYKDVSGEILISFSPDSGQRDLYPIVINAEDQELFDNIRISQRRTFKDQNNNFLEPLIRFKSDEYPLAYETYRTTKKPKTYKDFSGRLMRTTDAESASGFVEDIVPNIKYYYMFRTIDRHGKFSNPSPVYMFEMVDNGGALYPLVSVLDMEDWTMKNKTYSEGMGKYIQIQPALAQTLLNEEASGITGETAVSGIDPVLGISNESIWNDKKFKIRLTSRSTGRKIDLNVDFTTDHENLSKFKPYPIPPGGPIQVNAVLHPKFYTGEKVFGILDPEVKEMVEEQKGELENGSPGADGGAQAVEGGPPPAPKSSIDY